MKKQILTGVLLSVLAVSSAYAHKDKKDAKKPKFSTELVVAQNDKKDAKKPKFSTELVVAQNDKKDAKKPKFSTELVVAQKQQKKTLKNLKTQWPNGFDSKKAFLKTLFWILFYNFLPFLKPLMGFIALLTLSKVKFKSFIYTEFYQYGCVF